MMFQITKKIVLCCVILIAQSFYTCNGQYVNTNLEGDKILYLNTVEGDSKLVLFNPDTKKEVNLENIDEIERSNFMFFANGEKMIIDSYNTKKGKLFSYNLGTSEKNEFDIRSYNDMISGFYDPEILGNLIYFASGKNIFAHSVDDYKLIKKYSFKSEIAEFAVLDEDIIAFTTSSIDLDQHNIEISNIQILNSRTGVIDTLQYGGGMLRWSKDRTNLFFLDWNFELIILKFPACIPLLIASLEKEGIDSYEKLFFISDHEIVLTGRMKSDAPDVTNIFLFDITTEKFTKLTNSNTLKEIKATYY